MIMQSLLRLCLFLSLIFVIPVAVYAAPEAGGFGAGRLLPTLAAVAGLTGIIIGWRSRNSAGQTRVIIAGALGLVSMVTGVLHAANSAGGFGTGNGLAGAIVAIMLGLAGITISGVALVRSRRL